MRRSRILVLISLSVIFFGCQREAPVKSTIVIQAPKSQKVSGQSTPWPSDRKACFGVNVTATDIPLNYPSCSPTTGIVAGYVEPDQTIEVDVPMGKSRKIDLYLYLQPAGQNNPCPKIGPSFSGTYLSETYLIGSATADLASQTETVTITASFPGLSNNIATQNSMPTTCTATTPPPSGPPGFNVGTAAGVAAGTGYKMLGRIGGNGTVMTGTGYNLKIK